MEIHRLADGTEIEVRPIQPDDEPLIVELHEAHSDDTIRMRFFSMVRHLSHESLIRLCHLDHDRAMALVAVHRSPDGKPHIIGVSRFYRLPETDEAEFAVVVTDAWQGKGVGRHLMRRLMENARQRGIKQLIGDVLRENVNMLQLMDALGFRIRPTDDPTVVQAVAQL